MVNVSNNQYVKYVELLNAYHIATLKSYLILWLCKNQILMEVIEHSTKNV